MGLQKICKIFASELGFKLGIMRGFQKGITLGGRTLGSAQKVFGRWWWWVVGGLLDFKVYLSPLLGEGVRSRIERCSREGSRDVRERVPREGSERCS